MAYNKYLKRLKRRVRLLRPSKAEQQFLKVMGWKWRLWHRVRREHPIAGYLVDFAIPKKQIAIEIDGAEYHKDYIKDAERDKHLYWKGWLTLRIPARDVYRNPDQVRYLVKFFLIHGKRPTKYPKSLK